MKSDLRAEREKNIENYAHLVHHYLKSNGYVRTAANAVETITIEDLASEAACDFDLVDWEAIKDKMLDLGFPIVYLPGRGHYLGLPGEVVMNVLYTKAQIEGRLARMRRWMIIFGETHVLDDGNKWATQHGYTDLSALATRLKQNDMALPAELHLYLLESKNG
jgi:hypothetical protein